MPTVIAFNNANASQSGLEEVDGGNVVVEGDASGVAEKLIESPSTMVGFKAATEDQMIWVNRDQVLFARDT